MVTLQWLAMRTTQQEVNLTSFSREKPSARRSRSLGTSQLSKRSQFGFLQRMEICLEHVAIDITQEYAQRSGLKTCARVHGWSSDITYYMAFLPV